jgi:hypothetical protein
MVFEKPLVHFSRTPAPEVARPRRMSFSPRQPGISNQFGVEAPLANRKSKWIYAPVSKLFRRKM